LCSPVKHFPAKWKRTTIGDFERLSQIRGKRADRFTIMNEMVSPTGRITALIRQSFERMAV
jgi:hypothetical protein